MATWGQEARVKYRAWNTSTNAGVAGDSANHTLTLRRAGTDSAFVGTVNDLGNGVYEAVVSGTLAETYELAMRGTSSTADVVLFFEAPVRTVKAAPTLTEIANQIEADHGAGSYVDTGAPLDATATEAAALAAVNSYAPAKAGDAMTLTTGERAAVRSDLLTKTQFDAALPGNFGVLSIDTSGNVTTTGGGGGSLTPEQATWLEETHTKAMLIGTGGAFVEVINPVGPGGKITLYSGYDYTSATTPISLPGATVDDATEVTLHAVPDRYGDEGEAIDLTGTVAGGEYVLEATRVQIPVSRVGQYRYQVWADDGGDHALLAAGTLVIARGK